MPGFTQSLRRAVGDPRLRVLIVLLLLLLAFALGWHLVGMGDHTMMLGACLAVVAILGLFALLRPRRLVLSIPATAAALPAQPALELPLHGGRHPPDEGTVLRL